MSRQSIISYSLAVLILAGAGYFYYWQTRTTGPDVDLRKFSGSIVNVSGDTITLRGFFEGPTGTIPGEFLSKRDFSFKVDNSTEFEKLETYLPEWPTKEELAQGPVSTTFNIEDLPNNRTSGSLQDLKNLTDSAQQKDPIVRADFNNSVYNFNNPVASFVFYHILVEPLPPSSIE